MIESNDSASLGNKTEEIEPLEQSQLWVSWLQQAASIGSDIFQLLQLELQLAFSDSKRLLVLALLFIPMLILSWIGISVLLAWLVYLINNSVTQGLIAFSVIQFLGLMGISLAWKHYKKSLSLPLTRQHIRQLIAGKSNDT